VHSHTVTNSGKQAGRKRDYRPKFDIAEVSCKPIVTRYEFAFLIGSSVGLVDKNLGTLIPYFKLGGRVLIDRVKALAALEKATGREVKNG
jgi:hypothetical protein